METNYIRETQEENLKLIQRNEDLKKELDQVRKWNDELHKEIKELRETIEYLTKDCD